MRVTIDGVDVPVTELVPVYWPDNGSFDWLVRAAGQGALRARFYPAVPREAELSRRRKVTRRKVV